MKALLQIKIDYYLMVIALFFMKTGQFMSLPFLALYLHATLTPTRIGLVIGIGALSYGLSGVFSGFVADKLGVKNSMALALLISGSALTFFFYFPHTVWYIMMSVLFGIGRSIFNVSSKTYGVTTYAPHIRRFCFSLRNMMVDAAAAVGPLLGALFAYNQSTRVFILIGLVYYILAIFAVVALKNNGKPKKQVSLTASLGTILHDSKLQLLLAIFFIYWVCFSQLDSILPLYLTHQLHNGLHIYTAMLIIEAVGCVVLQLLFTHITKNISDFILSGIGMLCFALGYAVLGSSLHIALLILSILFIIFGQIIILPLNDLLISKLAPEEHMATYYGATTLSAVGMGIGPFLGGIIYQYAHASILFLGCASLCGAAILLYRLLIKQSFSRYPDTYY